jgi:hypothetical protein
MVNNSTLLFIIDELNGEREIININELFDQQGECNSELDSIFGVFDYLPSDETINRILLHV